MTAQPLPALEFADARQHLRAELELLDLLLERHIARLRAAQLLNETDFRGLYIADEEVDALLSKRAPHNAGIGSLTLRIDALRDDLASRQSASLPLGILQRKLSLDRFEVELLVLAAACEIDLRYQTLFAYAQNDVTCKLPTVHLALQLLCDSEDDRFDRRAAFAPAASLLRHRLVRLGSETQDHDLPLLAHAVRADSRVADYLLGRADALDPRLAACAHRAPPEISLRTLPLASGLRERIDNLLPQLGRGASTVAIEGIDGTGRHALARAIAGQLGYSTLTVDPSELTDEMLALVRREALLSGDAIIIHKDFAFPDLRRPLFLVLERGEPRPSDAYSITLDLPAVEERERLWREAVGDQAPDLSTVAARFALTPAQIRSAALQARAAAAFRPAHRRALRAEDLMAGAQAASCRGLRRLALLVRPLHAWGDLVLPPRPLQQLRDVARSLAFRNVVHDRWGFARRLPGTGLAVLFTGPSGTGKTMAASIVARELGLEMYRIDLSAVVSKYIGETEKNLDRIFAEAESSNAVLFFDEADALFGRRSEVKDAHDRYANIEIAYLLQRVESYDGIVILATNLGRNIDEAFARRMFDTIEFPMPDVPQRERIWRGLLAGGAPVANDVDASFLARQFELSGGNIRNIVLAAAFAAAAASAAITMQSLILATAREIQKIGRLPSRGEFREFYDLVREAGV